MFVLYELNIFLHVCKKIKKIDKTKFESHISITKLQLFVQTFLRYILNIVVDVCIFEYHFGNRIEILSSCCDVDYIPNIFVTNMLSFLLNIIFRRFISRKCNRKICYFKVTVRSSIFNSTVVNRHTPASFVVKISIPSIHHQGNQFNELRHYTTFWIFGNSIVKISHL